MDKKESEKLLDSLYLKKEHCYGYCRRKFLKLSASSLASLSIPITVCSSGCEKNNNKIISEFYEVVSGHLDMLEDEKEAVITSIINLKSELMVNAPKFTQFFNKICFESAVIYAAIYISIKERIETGSLKIVNNVMD